MAGRGQRGAAHAGFTSWDVSRRRGDAALLHGLARPAPERFVRVCEVTGPALVLGSTQPDDDVDRARVAEAGVEVVRRRTGGGAVLVRPGRMVWVDVGVPAGDPLWQDDVGRAFWWLGDVWAAALAAVGSAGAAVHRDGLVSTQWSRKLCFSGLGPGEVTLDGRKVVGMAQRRDRQGALFQCAVPLRWEPERLVDLLALTPAQRASAADDLRRSARDLPGVPAAELETALLSQLP